MKRRISRDGTMPLQSANSVREFGFIAECRGMANMHRQGTSAEAIAKKVGLTAPVAQHLIAIGYFPDDLHEMMQNASGHNSSTAPVEELCPLAWGHRTIREFLPLRQLLPGRDPKQDGSLDGVYDYAEVRRAIKMAVSGELATQEQIHAYVEQRRRELFEQRFNQELRDALTLQQHAA